MGISSSLYFRAGTCLIIFIAACLVTPLQYNMVRYFSFLQPLRRYFKALSVMMIQPLMSRVWRWWQTPDRYWILRFVISLQPARLREVKYRQQKARFLIAPSVSSLQCERSSLSMSLHCWVNFCSPRSVMSAHSRYTEGNLRSFTQLPLKHLECIDQW